MTSLSSSGIRFTRTGLGLPSPGVHQILMVGVCALAAVGCGSNSLTTAVAPAAAGALQGTVLGGQQPVTSAMVQLYAVGTSGTGSTSTPLITESVLTSAGGQFDLTGKYTCPSASAPVYLVASGGNPGLAAGTENKAIALMTALGPCGNLTPETTIAVNEVTTIAAVAALSPWMNSPSAIGSSPADAPNLAAAFTLADNFANPSNGQTPGVAVPTGWTVPTTTINSAADVLATCVNSKGGSAGDSSPCGMLFSYATLNGSGSPTNVVDAALGIASNPTQNVSAIFELLPSSAPFQPLLTEAPSDWKIRLNRNVATPVFSSTTASSSTTVTITDSTSRAQIFYTTNGATPTSASSVYTGPLTFTSTTTLKAIAVANNRVSAVASQTFTVAAAPKKLVFLTQPSSALTNASLTPAITVGLEDANSNVVPTANEAVTLSLGTNPTGTALSGTVTSAPASGIATFTSLSLPAAGTYTLVATSPGLTSAVSTAFTITAPVSTLPLVSPRSADSFVDSVGVNVHFNYYGSIYAQPVYAANGTISGYNSQPMITAIQTLGVRHLRDALNWQGTSSTSVFYMVHQQLGALGIKTDYTASINQPISQITAFPTLVPDMEAVEPANEYDISGDPLWPITIKAQQTAIYNAIKAIPADSGITVLAPSLAYPINASLLGNVGAVADAGNLHGYFGAWNPGSSTVNPTLDLKLVQPNTPSKPIWVTETGYFALPGPVFGMYGVSPAVQAVYSPRALLEYSNAGATRTYLYELADDFEPGEVAADYHWGLLNSDGSTKPSFTAISNLLTTLSDPGAAFTPTPLAYALTNATSAVHSALFQKRDGSYYLALWVEAQGYNFLTQTPMNVPAQNVTLQLGSSVASAATIQWDANGNITTAPLTPTQSLNLTVSDTIQLVKIVLN